MAPSSLTSIPRLAGTPDPQMVQLAYGIDLVTAHIILVIGEQWDLRRRHSLTAAARLLVPDRDGILDSINGEIRAAAVSGVSKVQFYVSPKTLIVRKGDYYRDYLGYVIAASPSLSRTKTIFQDSTRPN